MKTKKQKLGKLQLFWVKALESGKYRQTVNGCLRDEKGFCCLGVLEKLEGNLAKREPYENACLISDKENTIELSCKTTKKYSFRSKGGRFKKNFFDEKNDRNYSSLVDMNDSGDYTFKQIAKYIRENPENVFTKSV